ncbi:MAG: protein kinase [Kofleriaceae bacterium]|nr:protein kinase [Kofleriaceae bacterium]MCB9570647.1 protein kinase [Kofleriaceae bacterium]
MGGRDAQGTTELAVELPSVAGFRIRRLLGCGGMGQVYLARDERSRGYVALKVITTRLRTSPRIQARFATEIAATAKVRHPHVIRLRAWGTAHDAPYAVFDYVDGVELCALPRALPWQVGAHLAWQLADAVDAVHRAGLLHRDIKPANVMIGRTGWVTLIDLGLAKPVAPDRGLGPAAWPTVPGAPVGTPHYQAPELARGAPASIASDVFAMGMVLSRLLELRVRGPASQLEVEVEDAGAVPASLVALVRRCLAPVPARRPATVAELRDALAAVERRPLRVRPEPRASRPVTWPTPACDASTSDDPAVARRPPLALPRRAAAP